MVIPLKNENEFRLKPEELKAAITPRSKILVLPYPNNPTGAVMEKEDLEAIADIIIENDLYVLSDEIYGELTYSGSHVSIASLPGMKERTVLVNGFSKAYAMTGWRMGYACGPKEILAQMTKIHQYAIMCAPTTSQYAAIEALRNGDDDVAQMRESYNQRRRFVMHKLEGMGLPCFEPQGAFYVFPCIKEFGMSSEEFAEELLKEEKVAIVPGTAFGDSGEGYLRISYAYSIENLHEPEIPGNTGNIGRSCVVTGTSLHLIEPLGFEITEKQIRRSGLDYWKDLDVHTYADYGEFLARNPNAKIWYATTKAHQIYSDVTFGIPEEILVENEETCIRIPMLEGYRSLNLSNSVAIVLYEALRQQDFLSLERDGELHRLHWKSE